MTTASRRRLAWLGAVVLMAVSLAPLLWADLIKAPTGYWQVDLEVYRTAGVSHLIGRPVYETITPPPQLLPFTYPPFASMLAVPLGLLPFSVVGWVWYLLQALSNIAIVWIAGARWWRRPAWWWPLVFGAAVAVGFRLLPVSDGFRFGQVDAFLVLMVLADLTRWRPVRRIPHGVLIGLAAAIKLTPAIFIVYLALTRQWRAFWTSLGTAAAVTLFAAALDVQSSLDFWFGALLDPERLGSNDGVSNQSLRGLIHRLHGDNIVGTAVWLLLVAAVLWYGMRVAKQAHDLQRPIAAAAAVGLIGVLISPVSWIHHHDWMLVVFAALIAGAGRSRVRWVAIGALLAVYLLKWPWWGYWAMDKPVETGQPWPLNGWQLAANSFVIAAAAALVLLGRSLPRSEPAASAPAARAASGPPAESPSRNR